MPFEFIIVTVALPDIKLAFKLSNLSACVDAPLIKAAASVWSCFI